MYLRASGKSSIPEVKRIIVSYSDKMILADSVDSALEQLFSYKNTGNSQTANSAGNASSTVANPEKVQQAKSLYEKALESQKNGDWSKYGDYIKQLGDIINELNK